MGCGDTDDDDSPGPCLGYELAADIDLAGFSQLGPHRRRPTPRSSRATGNAIANLTIDRTLEKSLGLFAELGSTARVRNLGLTGASVTARLSGTGSVNRIGVLAGTNQGLVMASFSAGTLTCVKPAGATGSCVIFGGLIGSNDSAGRVRSSHAAVDVSGPISDAGGLVGQNDGGSIGASYAAGDVDGDARYGGLVGVNTGSIDASYAVGNVAGSGSLIGGLVGVNAGTVTDSYYDSDASGQSDTGKGEGKTTSDLITPTDYTGIYADWNLDLDGDGTDDDPWDFGNSVQYPANASGRPSAGTVTADAGAGQEVLTGATVTLDGSGSSSTIQNAALTYAWTQSGGPTVTLSSVTAEMPTFTAPSYRTDLEFQLVVNDGSNDSAPDTVTVAVRPPLNPATAPCPPLTGVSVVTASLITFPSVGDTSFTFRTTRGGASDLHVCRPDGTSEQLANDVAQSHVQTVSGLTSGTRYWAAVVWWDGTKNHWSDWQAVTTTGGASILAGGDHVDPGVGGHLRAVGGHPGRGELEPAGDGGERRLRRQRVVAPRPGSRRHRPDQQPKEDGLRVRFWRGHPDL